MWLQLTVEDIDHVEEALEMIELEKKRAFIEEKELSQLKSEMADYEEDIVDFKQVSKLVGASDRLITKSFPLFWLASKPLQNRTSFFSSALLGWITRNLLSDFGG